MALAISTNVAGALQSRSPSNKKSASLRFGVLFPREMEGMNPQLPWPCKLLEIQQYTIRVTCEYDQSVLQFNLAIYLVRGTRGNDNDSSGVLAWPSGHGRYTKLAPNSCPLSLPASYLCVFSPFDTGRALCFRSVFLSFRVQPLNAFVITALVFVGDCSLRLCVRSIFYFPCSDYSILFLFRRCSTSCPTAVHTADA